MKRRLEMIIVTIALTASMAGCSGKAVSQKELTSEDDPEKIFTEAMEKFRKESLKAAETKSVTTYDDGMEDEEHYTCILDEKKKIIERVSTGGDEDEVIYRCFNVKEKDGYGVYVNDELTGREWKYYKEDLEGNEESEYEYWISELDPFYTEEKGYSNIQYSNEGEDELNGKETVMIKATADIIEDYGIEDGEKDTRESILKENGWSEEEVNAVPGFSEILDAYVAASNKSEEPSTMQCSLTIWVSAKDHTILKSRSATNNAGLQDDETKAALAAYDDEFWKVDMVHQNVEDGMSVEEAKAALERELDAMGQPETAEDAEVSGEEFDDEMAEEYASVTKTVVTKKIMTGKECPEMSKLPETYEEIKQEEYFEGGFGLPEEDDYFSEGDEFDDEFE